MKRHMIEFAHGASGCPELDQYLARLPDESFDSLCDVVKPDQVAALAVYMLVRSPVS